MKTLRKEYGAAVGLDTKSRIFLGFLEDQVIFRNFGDF